MKFRILILLLMVALVNCQTSGTNTKPELLKTAKKAWAVIQDLFNIFFKNDASFRKLLSWASELVSEVFPLEPLPNVPEPWWGEDHQTPDNTIRPFKVVFSDEMISDLRARIHQRRNITRSLDGTANTYGTNSDYLAQFLDQWADKYDFKMREQWLNSFPQYITNIQGLNIHFIHVKPSNPNNKKVLPLLLLHGSPCTAFEYVHVIQQLQVERDDCEFVFEMVVPSLPGFGYSEATRKTGMSNYQMGIIMKNLMARLGKPRFYIHAGDAGQFVADNMAVLFPDKVLGLHTNFPFSLRPQTLVKLLLGQLYPPAVVETRYEDRMYPLTKMAKSLLENSGYLHLQASKPDNVGHGADDSPVALASWFIEAIISGGSHKNQLADDGNMSRIYDMRDWFDSFTIYWDSQCTATGIRLYAESLAFSQDPIMSTIAMTPSPVPFAVIRFRYELIYQPDDFLRDKYPNLVQATTLDFGGHFAGYQEPKILADSIWTAVRTMEDFNSDNNK